MASLCENTLCDSPQSDVVSMEVLIPKKVRFGEEGDSSKGVDESNLLVAPKVSWKNKLVGRLSMM